VRASFPPLLGRRQDAKASSSFSKTSKILSNRESCKTSRADGLNPKSSNRVPVSREAFNPSTNEATPELSMYRTLVKFTTTRGVRFSRSSPNSALRISGELARSISPDTSKIVVFSVRRAEICTGCSPLRMASFLGALQILDQSKLVDAARSCEFYGVHALPDEVQTESPRLYLIQSTSTQLPWVHRWSTVTQQDLQPFTALRPTPLRKSPEQYLDRPARLASIRMPHNICQRFIDRARNRAPLRRLKSNEFGQLLNCRAHNAQQIGIAEQLEFQ